MRKLILTIGSLVILSSLFAQVKMQGTITTKKNEKVVTVPFANIALFDMTDTTKVVKGEVTDFKGNYLFENLKMGRYLLEISCIGYKPIKKEMLVSLPAIGNVLKHNFQMEEDAQMLSEVVVEGFRTTQYVDKTVRIFTQKEIKSARYSKDLIETLPQLTTDAQTGKLKDIRGGSMQVLINGVRATDNELKLLPPNKVLKVEYYDIPPARYTQNGSVVNIITKTLDDGYSGGIDLLHAVTTGFGNNNAYFKYNKGHNQFTMEYAVNYRDYDERESERIYKYRLNNEDRESHYTLKDAFGYTNHRIGLKFTNRVKDKYVLQIGVKPNFQTSFSDGTKHFLNTLKNVEHTNIGNFNREAKVFSPAVDAYFWKKLTKTSDISLNVVGTMFRTKVDNENHEFELPSMVETLTDVMHLENRKKSLIGELAYTKQTKTGNLSAGYKVEATWLTSNISNIFGNYNYDSRYNEQYLYSEFSGNKNKLLYRMSLGGKIIHNNSYSNTYNKFVLTPQLIMGYMFSPKHTFRLMAERNTDLPSVSDLSKNTEMLTSDIISRGNPMLENATESNIALMYSFKSKNFDVTSVSYYVYIDNVINQYFSHSPNDEYITLTKENANNSQLLGFAIRGIFKPFETDIFIIKGKVGVENWKLNSDLVGKVSHWSTPAYLEGVFKKNNLRISYSYKLVSKMLSGAFWEDTENQSNLMARYRYKNFGFSAGIYWIGMPSKYHSETLDNSIVYNSSNTRIFDNKNMFVLGFSWNFHKGKSYNVNRKLQNEDNDAGKF